MLPDSSSHLRSPYRNLASCLRARVAIPACLPPSSAALPTVSTHPRVFHRTWLAKLVRVCRPTTPIIQTRPRCGSDTCTGRLLPRIVHWHNDEMCLLHRHQASQDAGKHDAATGWKPLVTARYEFIESSISNFWDKQTSCYGFASWTPPLTNAIKVTVILAPRVRVPRRIRPSH